MVDPAVLARHSIGMSLADRGLAMGSSTRVFFDRGLIDAAVALQHSTGETITGTLSNRVFFAPPWPAIYAKDRERRHSFEETMKEYSRLRSAYSLLGYEVCVLPRVSVQERVESILALLAD